MMNRRTFLQGIAAAAGALILPPTLEANAEAARRYWALDRTMAPSPQETLIRRYDIHRNPRPNFPIFCISTESYEQGDDWEIHWTAAKRDRPESVWELEWYDNPSARGRHP
jgi:hypothetical protein